MRVVLDTNVFISGVFFTGPPYEILDAWRADRLELILSPEILDEYGRVGRELAAEFPDVDLVPWIELLAVHGKTLEAPPLPEPVCSDPDDDEFLACAIAGRVEVIVSGDKALLRASGHHGIAVLRPREFIDSYLRSS